VNARNKHYETALIIAFGKEHTEIVQLLLEKGAGVNVKRYDDRTAYGLAENDEIKKILK